MLLEALHYASLAPLLYLIVWRRDAGVVYWLVALGFAVSWFADFGARLLDGSQALTYVYPAAQYGAFAWAFGHVWAAVGLFVVAAVQIIATDLARPDIIVTLLGSAVAVYGARSHALAWSMLTYCGLGTICYLLMVEDVWAEAFMVWWTGYQAARIIAFGLFVRAAWQEPSHA